MKNIKYLARRIICDHTEAMMACVEYHPENNHELYDSMVKECAYIVSEKLMNGELTPMEYNDLRNELAAMIWKIFAPHLEDE